MLIEAHYAGTTYLLKKSDLTWEGGEVTMKTALITLMTLSCQWSWFWHNLGWRWQDFPSLHTNWNCVKWSAKPKENLKGRLWAFDPNASCVCLCVSVCVTCWIFYPCFGLVQIQYRSSGSNIYFTVSGWSCGQTTGREPGRTPCKVFFKPTIIISLRTLISPLQACKVFQISLWWQQSKILMSFYWKFFWNHYLILSFH